MRMRRRNKAGDDAAVMLSPLIDCVFLLLIFFLVTSIIKRYERQIPVTLADPTASVAQEVRSDVYQLGLSVSGVVHREVGRDELGIVRFQPVDDLPALLARLTAGGAADTAIELVVEQRTPFQRVIDLLDTLQHAGLTEVRSRIRDGDL